MKLSNPQLLAGLTVLFWSFSALLAKLISLQSPYVLFSISFFFALLVYLAFALRKLGKNVFKYIKKAPLKYYLIGICGYYGVWLGNTESFRAYGTASETTVLNYTWLIFTVFFFEVFFSTHKSKGLKAFFEYLGLFLGFLAIIVLATKGNITSFNFFNTAGLLWGIFGGLSYGFFSAFSSTIKNEDRFIFLITGVLGGLAAMLVTAYFTEADVVESFSSLSLKQILLAAALGILVDALGYIMWTKSLSNARKRGLSIGRIVSLIFILPITSLIIVSYYFYEKTWYEDYFLISLGILLAGIIITQWSSGMAKMVSKYNHR